MKKFVIIGILVLLVLAMVLGPLLGNGGTTPDVGDENPAEFTFESNLATRWDEVIPLKIAVNSEDVVKIDLIYNDSIFQTWKDPKKNLEYAFNAGFFGLGTRPLVLLSTLKDGTTFMDNRMVRVLSDVKPDIWIAEIASSLPHQSTSFTQGLEFNSGILYEGTGQKGASFVAQVDLKSGNILKKMELGGNYFGEGISILGDKLYQITWQEQTCFIYDKKSLELIKDVRYSGEGWGLCNDGSSLIMSDGTERLTYRDPETFEIVKTIEVYDDKGPITKLNELEYIDGLIYANIWMTSSVAVIQPENGKVIAIIDGAALVKEGRNGGDVMNGIAHNSETGKIYMTGKNWTKLFEVRLKKPVV
jgi:glutaminyl-peptide cyclotransferase